MSKPKVLIAGGSGAIGNVLASYLEHKNFEVRILTRNRNLVDGIKFFYWDVDKLEIDEICFRNIEYVIQLAGANISENRWTSSRKIEILNSRVNSTNFIFQSVMKNNLPLKGFISASAIGYYGAVTRDKVFIESDSPGNDFLALTCKKWEEATNQFTKAGIRTVTIRTGIVLMQKEGAISKLLTTAKFGLSAPLGSGKQIFPWIHLIDLCNIYIKVITDNKLTGPYNAVSPSVTTNKEFLQTLCSVLKRPMFLPNISPIVLKIIFGEMASTLLNGSKISASKILNSGFVFQFADLKKALENLLTK